jgi:hypothetical protein
VCRILNDFGKKREIKNMGRYYWSKKDTVEDSTKLSISKLKEFGLLGGCCSSTLTWTRSLSGHKSSIGIVVDVLDEPYVKLNPDISPDFGVFQ